MFRGLLKINHERNDKYTYVLALELVAARLVLAGDGFSVIRSRFVIALVNIRALIGYSGLSLISLDTLAHVGRLVREHLALGRLGVARVLAGHAEILDRTVLDAVS